MNVDVEKQHAHELIERIPADRITTVVRFMEFMLIDPAARAVATAPPDDEPVTEEEKQAIARSEAWLTERQGRGIPMVEVLAEFGLTMEDFPLSTETRGS